MKKLIIILFVLAVVFWFSYDLFIRSEMKNIGVFSDKEPSIEDVIVVDSLEINNKTIYWFCFDLGVRGYSNGKLSYTNDKKQLVANTFFHSSYITGLEYDSSQSLLIVHTFKKIEEEVRIPDGINLEFKEGGDPQKLLDARLMKLKSDDSRIDLSRYQ